MIQETIAHQDGITNTKTSKKKFFGNILKFKFIIRKKNKSKHYNHEYSNTIFCNDTTNLQEYQEESPFTVTGSSTKILLPCTTSSSETSLPVIIESQPVASTSVTSFSDKGSIKPESTNNNNSRSKSSSLFNYFPRNNSSILRHKSSTTSEISTISNGSEILNTSSNNNQDNLTKKRKFFNIFNRIDLVKKGQYNVDDNDSDIRVNSSIESSNSEEQNDSVYEIEDYHLKKKKKKSQDSKIIKKTKLLTLSKNDDEYIEIQKFFHIGLPNKKIKGIIKLQMPTKVVEAHQRYKNEILSSQDCNLTESQICHRMFHGTKTGILCKPQYLINNKVALLCKIGCGACGIIKEGNRTKYSHYTHRMWFANNSATSLNYCNGNVKAMFVVDVVSTTSGAILIIDRDEATIPKYLIIFQE